MVLHSSSTRLETLTVDSKLYRLVYVYGIHAKRFSCQTRCKHRGCWYELSSKWRSRPLEELIFYNLSKRVAFLHPISTLTIYTTSYAPSSLFFFFLLLLDFHFLTWSSFVAWFPNHRLRPFKYPFEISFQKYLIGNWLYCSVERIENNQML